MGRKSKINFLSEELRSELIRLLNKPGVTQQEVTDAVNKLAGAKVVSKSSVNRYAQKMEEFSRKSREARAVAEMLGSQMNNGQSNVLGKVAIEQARIIIFELFGAIDEINKSSDDPEKLLNLSFGVSKLVKAVNELEKASETNIKLEEKIKAKTVEVAEKVEKTVRSGGLSEENIAKIKADILGIA